MSNSVSVQISARDHWQASLLLQPHSMAGDISVRRCAQPSLGAFQEALELVVLRRQVNDFQHGSVPNGGKVVQSQPSAAA